MFLSFSIYKKTGNRSNYRSRIKEKGFFKGYGQSYIAYRRD